MVEAGDGVAPVDDAVAQLLRDRGAGRPHRVETGREQLHQVTGDDGVLDQHVVDVGGGERRPHLAPVPAVGPQHGHVVPCEAGPQHQPVEGVDLGPAVPQGQSRLGQAGPDQVNVEGAPVGIGGGGIVAGGIGDGEVVEVGPVVVIAVGRAQGVGLLLHRPQPEALDDGEEPGQLDGPAPAEDLEPGGAARHPAGGEHDGDRPIGGQGVELEDVVDRGRGDHRPPVGRREPVRPGMGQAGAAALPHPLDQGLGQLLVPGPAQQADLPLERVQRRFREGAVDLDDQAGDHVRALAQGHVGVHPHPVELSHQEALDALAEGRRVQLLGDGQQGGNGVVLGLDVEEDLHVVALLGRGQPDDDLAQAGHVGLEQLLLGEDLEQRHEHRLVVAALDHILQLEDAPELEPQHRRHHGRLSRRLAAEHADHPEGAGHAPVGSDVDHVDAVHRHPAVHGAHLGRPDDAQGIATVARGGGVEAEGSGRVGEDAEGVGDLPVDQPARAFEHEVVVEQPLEEVGPLTHLVGREPEGGMAPQPGRGPRHLLPHGQEVAGGGEHVGQDGPDGREQDPPGLGGDAAAQLRLEERLAVLGVAGGQDGGQPPVSRPLAPEDGVEDAGDLVPEAVKLLLHRGHDELAVLAADLDDGAGGVPAVDGDPGVDQTHPDPTRRASIDEVEGVDQGHCGGHRVGVLQLSGRHPPQHDPSEGLHQPAPLAGRAHEGEDGLQGLLERRLRLLVRPVGGWWHQAPRTRSRTVSSRSNEARTSSWSSARWRTRTSV